MYTQKKGLPLQIDWTPTECSTLGVSFEPKSAQYSDETREVASYYLCRSNASEGESFWEEKPRLEEHLMHVSIGAYVHIIMLNYVIHGPANLFDPQWLSNIIKQVKHL